MELTVQITPLAELLAEGTQAITISPGAIQAVNGFVQAGDRINAIITLDIDFALTALAEQAPDFGIPVHTDSALAPPSGEPAPSTAEQKAKSLLALSAEVRYDPRASSLTDPVMSELPIAGPAFAGGRSRHPPAPGAPGSTTWRGPEG